MQLARNLFGQACCRALMPPSNRKTSNARPHIVEEVFTLDAEGYVGKMDAETDVLLAVEAVICGKQFVSRDLGDR